MEGEKMGIRDFGIIDPIRDYYPVRIKNPYNSTRDKQAGLNLGKGLECCLSGEDVQMVKEDSMGCCCREREKHCDDMAGLVPSALRMGMENDVVTVKMVS
jgi:hypothetical protein